MRTLVTGGAGFIGSHLVAELVARGDEIVVVDDLSMGRRENLPPGVRLVVADVRHPDAIAAAVDGVDTLFHLAARVTIRGSVESFLDDAEANVMGTVGVLEACRRAARRPRRIVYASSMAVYADRSTIPIGEGASLDPGSPYGIAKMAGERYVHLLSRQLGMESVALRYFNTYGERQTPTPYVGVMTIFLRALLRGETPTIFGSGAQVRDFVYAGDVARATLLAATSPAAADGTFNVGTGHGTSILELFERIRATVGSDVEPRFAPRPAGEPQDSVADTTRAREVLGFVSKTRIEQVLGRLVDHYRGAGTGR